jgi:serpin B
MDDGLPVGHVDVIVGSVFEVRSSHSVAAGVAALALFATACGGQQASNIGAVPMSELKATGVHQEAAPADAPVGEAAKGMRQFGYDLMGADDVIGNEVISPLSLSVAFAMLREGARGETAQQIDDVLGFPAEGRADAYNALLHDLASLRGKDLQIADGTFIQHGFDPRTGYLDTLARSYGSGMQSIDFGSPYDAAELINTWVADHTGDRIKKLVDPAGLDPTTVLMLVNAINMDAKWTTPFDPGITVDAPFAAPGGDETVRMMHDRQMSVDYSHGEGWQAVRLPYQDGSLSMWVLLPRLDDDPQPLLSPETLSSVAWAHRRVDVSLPKWNLRTRLSPIGALKSLGMTDVFDPFRANLAGISPGIYVNLVEHVANITVGEKGTKAAAATAIGAAPVSGFFGSRPRFTVDHPFAFAIMDDATGIPVFEGVVTDPSQ